MNSFKQTQLSFAQSIRTGKAVENLVIENRRLAVYQELFFNNVEGFVSSAFPVLRSLYAAEDWQSLIRTFFIEHPCHSPHFVDISKEFIQFLSEEYQLKPSDPCFMRELAHYEWVELDLSIQTNEEQLTTLPPQIEIIRSSRFELSPITRIVSYPYPVHHISQTFQPQAPSDRVYLLVYRNERFAINFIEINPVVAFTLDLITKRVANDVESLISQLQPALAHIESDVLQTSLLDSLVELAQLDLLLELE
ncbi:hypothetical protein DS2_11118 [Catenovulum agarivorans DS-2]|uniref:Uncharacterized protein n=1 Tax=Catenovulum agarivorans DS-2 TaxID=1328313 RepID=W7QP67_9ALTE|nr:putative DNA-binding domain-containing protein [Catenovulum agarivorans]EWH09678.1 hypothetical protein DS2_11118 [Catenovulum agarivorans DS-2]